MSLTSLALPWAFMVLVSVAAAFALYPREVDDELDSSYWSFQRLLEGEHHHEHVHKHVFEESHKPLWPLDSSDYAGLGFTIIGLMIAAGGGIGGGGILVPIFILVMGFTPKHAIPLSNITVFAGAIANNALNMSKRHPLADRPL